MRKFKRKAKRRLAARATAPASPPTPPAVFMLMSRKWEGFSRHLSLRLPEPGEEGPALGAP